MSSPKLKAEAGNLLENVKEQKKKRSHRLYLKNLVIRLLVLVVLIAIKFYLYKSRNPVQRLKSRDHKQNARALS